MSGVSGPGLSGSELPHVYMVSVSVGTSPPKGTMHKCGFSLLTRGFVQQQTTHWGWGLGVISRGRALIGCVLGLPPFCMLAAATFSIKLRVATATMQQRAFSGLFDLGVSYNSKHNEACQLAGEPGGR